MVVRRQVLDALIAQTPFDLPPDLVSRQEKSTISRLVMELRQEGFTDNDIKAREAEIRANAHETTLRSLKEFFILAKDSRQPGDQGRGRRPRAGNRGSRRANRRKRAAGSERASRRRGWAKALAVQILERKALDHILKSVDIEDVPLDEPETAVETVDQTATPAEARESESTGE